MPNAELGTTIRAMLEVDASSRSPLVHAVVARLTEMIADGSLQVGSPLPSERDLAAQMEVSRPVIRAALQELTHQGLVVSRPRCRPVVVGGRPVGPVPSDTLNGHISLCLWPNIDSVNEALILKGVREGVLGTELRFLIANASGRQWSAVIESERKFLESVAQDPQAIGLVIWYLGGDENLPWLRRVRDAGKPMVFVDRRAPAGFPCDHVGTDNLGAAQTAVSHLISLGHRRIAFLSNIDRATSVAERTEGYRMALLEAGLPFDESLVIPAKSDEPGEVARLAKDLLARREAPTAMFCVNDTVALEVLAFAEEYGIQVPDELSVVGFDGLLARNPGGSRLTTCVQNFYRVGQEAIRLLVDRVHSPSSGNTRHILLDAPLSVGGSTAAPQTVEAGFPFQRNGDF